MELKDFILTGIERTQQATMKAIEDLTDEEVRWRPGPEANSIGIILLHLARLEDTSIVQHILGKPQLWESEKWYEKLNLAVTEVGAHYTREQLAAVRVPEITALLSYG